MGTSISKWGNSLAIRIPQHLAKKIHLEEGAEVEIHVENGSLVIKPRSRRRYSLEELVQGITPENCHSETETGIVVGNEVW